MRRKCFIGNRNLYDIGVVRKALSLAKDHERSDDLDLLIQGRDRLQHESMRRERRVGPRLTFSTRQAGNNLVNGVGAIYNYMQEDNGVARNEVTERNLVGVLRGLLCSQGASRMHEVCVGRADDFLD